MTYTVAQLIADSFYLSGKRTEQIQPVTGTDISKGLRLLNSALAVKTANNRLIPYYTQYDFTAVVGQEKYFIPNCIEIETFVWFLQGVRMYSTRMDRREYFGSSRVENVIAPPFTWHDERTLNGIDLYLYFQPDQEYPLTIWGKFALTNVVLSQDLSATLEGFYIEYLRYLLADYICEDSNITFQPKSAEKLRAYEKQIMDISPIDTSVRKISAYSGQGSMGFWSVVNLSKGWVPW